MPVVRSEYQTSERLPALIQYDLGGTLTMPLELLGADITPTSVSSVVLTDGSSTITLATPSVGPPPSVAVTPAALLGKTLGLAYEARWTLVFTGVTRTFRQRVGIVRWAPDCPVSDSSILNPRPVLARMLAGTNYTSMDPWISAGWEKCQRWLASKGSRAHLVCDMSELYELAEAFIIYVFLDDQRLGADPTGTIVQAFNDAKERLKEAKDSTVLTYDPDDSTEVVTEQRPANPSFYLASNPGEWEPLR